MPAPPRSGLPRQPAYFLEDWLDAADRQALLEEGWDVFTCLDDMVVLRLPAGVNPDGEPLTRATLQVSCTQGGSSPQHFELHLAGARLDERLSCSGPELSGCVARLLARFAR